MLIKTITAITLGLSFFACASAAPLESEIQVDNGGSIRGMLELPDSSAPAPVVLLVADGGPAGRDGNGPGGASGSLRQLAHALAAQGIASVRYDKAGGAASIERDAQDAAAWIQLLKKDARFNKVVVIGHGEGLLTGLLAANAVGANGFVSLDGSSARFSGFDPAAEFGKLHMHARIIQGSADLTVGMENINRLEQARPGTPVAVIKGMNHALTLADGEQAVAPELVTAIVGFINMGPH